MTTALDTEQQVVYSLGHNMPGYLPDSPGTVVATWAEAKERMIDDLLFFAQYAATEDDAENFTHEAEDLNLCNGPHCATEVGIETFWIEPIWVEDADELLKDVDYEG